MDNGRPMKERLKHYRYIDLEIRRLEQKLEALPELVTDSVESSAEFPYSKHAVTIRGVPAKRLEYERRIVACKMEKAAIEQYVDEMPDIRIRQIVHLRYFQSKRWADIAAVMGYPETEDTVRKAVDRFF